MTHTIAIPDRKFRSIQLVLLADAASCLAMGLLLALGAGMLDALLGLPADLLLWVGLLLFPCAALMLIGAQRPGSGALRLIIAGNLAWIAGSVGVLELCPGMTAAGMAFVVAQAVAVAVLTAWEWRGLKLLAA